MKKKEARYCVNREIVVPLHRDNVAYMKKVIGIILLLFIFLPLSAQDGTYGTEGEPVSAETYGQEHTNVLKIHAGYGRQIDTYLSPMAYRGWQLGLGNEWWQAFRQDTKLGRTGRLANWGHVGRVDLAAGRLVNTAQSNLFYSLHIDAGWGAFYCWKWIDDRLKVHVGPYLEGSFAVREHGSNVNKIVSFDVAVEAMAMGGVSWSFYGKKTSYRLNYLIRTNLIGFDFLPEYWESYYEISQGVPGQARCSGPWNHHTLKHELTLDLQFPHSTWRVGAAHELNDYGTKDLHFSRNQIQLVIGCIWKYRINPHSRL